MSIIKLKLNYIRIYLLALSAGHLVMNSRQFVFCPIFLDLNYIKILLYFFFLKTFLKLNMYLFSKKDYCTMYILNQEHY